MNDWVIVAMWGSIVIVLLVGQWIIYHQFGKTTMTSALEFSDLLQATAMSSMLFVEQTLKCGGNFTDQQLKKQAVAWATKYIKDIGVDLTWDEVKILSDLIESSLREFKGKTRSV
jgi:hypothetical protein